jgi:putative nucleotidyltransferase with HDIG domain
MKQSLEALIAATSELRSLPSTTMRLMQLLDDAMVDATTVLAVIEKDPSLTSNMLKLANSAYYGLRKRVGSAREALILLGNQTIVSLAFATSMGDVLRGPLKGYGLARNEMWQHALGTAMGAARLATAIGGEMLRERAFTGGLVHDIGKLILNKPLSSELAALPEDCGFECLLETENGILGFNHAEAGAALAETWNFPSTLVRIIRYHHEIGAVDQDQELVRSVAAANLVTCYFGVGGGTGPIEDAVFWDRIKELGFTEELIEDLMEQLPQDLEGMLDFSGETR